MIDKKILLNFFDAEKKLSFIQIAKKFNVSPKENKLLTKLLFELINENEIIKNNKDSSYERIVYLSSFKGILKINSNGFFGFIENDNKNNDESKENESYFIHKEHFNKALDNDEVEAKIYKNLYTNKIFSMVNNILNRNLEYLYGFLEQKGNYISFNCFSKKMKMEKIRIKNNLINARLNDVVKAKIVLIENNILWIDIVEKISKINDPMCYVKTLLSERGVVNIFPLALNEEIKSIPSNLNNENFKNRIDLTKELIVTIDGDDTKDYDDAISVRKLENGNFLLGVHIADVSHYVKVNSRIDEEAKKRGTSIYLANDVIPMLPKELSNGICSLNPNEKRFTISVFIEYDSQGNILKTEFKETIIESKYRLTYNNVNEFWKGNFKYGDLYLCQMLNNMRELSKIIGNKKYEQGYIDFEIQEPKLVLDENGKVIDIKISADGESEKMIENFMVAANEAVAYKLTQKNFPVLYRVHEVPDEEKKEYFKSVLKDLNVYVKFKNEVLTSKSFQNIIENIKKQRNDEFMKLLYLRTMSKAVYSSNNLGHFGLASQAYCHFTSPIRRYPDLVVHRILKDLFLHNKINMISYYKDFVQYVAEPTSNSEQAAVDLERSVNDLKFAEYYKSQIGKTFQAQIVSILKFGMFVEFPNKTDALIHISTIGKKDEFIPNENCTKLISINKTYTLGDTVNVVIVNADEVNGKVDAVLDIYYNQYLKDLSKKLYKNEKDIKFFSKKVNNGK